MQNRLEIKPRRLNHLLQTLAFALILGALTSFVSIVVFRDNLKGFSASLGEITGFLFGALLLWAYDDLTKYKRLVIRLTDKAVVFPGAWFTTSSLPLAELDTTRTLIYNSENNFRNRSRYTFWSKDGNPFAIGKYLYGQVQVNTLLKEIENLRPEENPR